MENKMIYHKGDIVKLLVNEHNNRRWLKPLWDRNLKVNDFNERGVEVENTYILNSRIELVSRSVFVIKIKSFPGNKFLYLENKPTKDIPKVYSTKTDNARIFSSFNDAQAEIDRISDECPTIYELAVQEFTWDGLNYTLKENKKDSLNEIKDLIKKLKK